MSKRVCLPPPNVSASTFDLRIRPLYPHSGTEMPVCVEIEANVLSQSKEYATTLIVLADVSGSMLDGTKLRNMREGIVRLGELAERFCTASVELILIEFNDAARLTLSVPKMPLSQSCSASASVFRPTEARILALRWTWPWTRRRIARRSTSPCSRMATIRAGLSTSSTRACSSCARRLGRGCTAWGSARISTAGGLLCFFSAPSQQSSALLAGSSTHWRAPLVARPSRASRTWTSPGSWARFGV